MQQRFEFLEDSIKEYLDKEIEAIKKIPYISNDFWCAINLLEETNKIGGKIIVTGMGKAGQVGVNIATTLSSTGTPAIFIHAAEAQHGDLGMIQKNDTIIVLSNSGETNEVIKFIDLARILYPLISVISIVGKVDSTLANISEYVLHTGDQKEICPLGLTPTTSTTAMMVIGDILVVELMKRINFTKEEYSKRHHGGYLGEKSKK
jgi:arabinose-5-phosphate isomerase